MKKYDDKHEVKNNSNSESSNKETNGSSVKNNIFDINIKLYDDNHINYDCLNNKFLFDIDNNKILKSFNSSKDSEFSQNNI